MFNFHSNYTPIVGLQLTLGVDSGQQTLDRLNMFLTRALVKEPGQECDLIVKGYIDGAARGALMLSSGEFKSDRSEDATWSLAQLVELGKTARQEMTFTCTATLTDERLGIDRNLNGTLDGDK